MSACGRQGFPQRKENGEGTENSLPRKRKKTNKTRKTENGREFSHRFTLNYTEKREFLPSRDRKGF
jgi:hypothetical protein